jgi:hypothetical protein
VTTNEIQHVLLWCVGLNYAILFIWFGTFVSVETFDAMHYGGLSVFKIGIILLNLVPSVAFCLVR